MIRCISLTLVYRPSPILIYEGTYAITNMQSRNRTLYCLCLHMGIKMQSIQGQVHISDLLLLIEYSTLYLLRLYFRLDMSQMSLHQLGVYTSCITHILHLLSLVYSLHTLIDKQTSICVMTHI
jgi:hypothetical protein